jgi:peptidoglycan/xylan/chitin deacetylase (PgdA/CDA1 family)
MKKYLHKTPLWIQKLYPGFVWQVPTDEREIFLTFDDGPVPEATDHVLEQLKAYNAKATFFCVGENMVRYPDIAQRIFNQGHAIGNHTHNHLKGWQTHNFTYLRNTLQCEQEIEKLGSRKLFRPPYGRITRAQARALNDYRIVMWNRLSWDFDKHVNHKTAIKYLCDAPPGSVLVFHDSPKSFDNMAKMLPQVLDHYSRAGFKFSAL